MRIGNRHKLSDEQVRLIRYHHADTVDAELSTKYSTSEMTINRVRNFQSYLDVIPGPSDMSPPGWMFCLRPIPDCRGYYAAIDGSIWSQRIPHSQPKKLKQQQTALQGYKTVLVRLDNGKKLTRRVHQLMLLAFRGPRVFPHTHACHNDGDVSNNVIENLRWDTPHGNMADKKSHGTNNEGESNCAAKFSDVDIQEIIRSSEPVASLADRYRVHFTTIYRIRRGHSWKHLTTTPTGDSSPAQPSENR